MNSALYVGNVRHRRFLPRANHFRYSLFMVYLDLAELDQVFDQLPLWSREGWGLANFRRDDHFGDPAIGLDQTVRRLVEEKTGEAPRGPIRMLTHLRYFGYVFNPVCFYYCFSPDEATVDTIVAEVSNTPWHERHLYVLGPTDNEARPPRHRHRFDKVFHVSPFMPMELDYDWRFSKPGPNCNVHMILRKEGDQVFDATLRLQRRPLDGRSAPWMLLRYPFMTWKVTFLIHWQALRLYSKGVPFHVHPSKRTQVPR